VPNKIHIYIVSLLVVFFWFEEPLAQTAPPTIKLDRFYNRSDEVIEGVLPTSDGGFLVYGSAFCQSSRGASMRKVNNNGAEQWSKCYTADLPNALISQVIEVADGYVYVGGTQKENGGALILGKISKGDGNIVWSRALSFGNLGMAGAIGHTLVETTLGNIMVGGTAYFQSGELCCRSQALLAVFTTNGNIFIGANDRSYVFTSIPFPTANVSQIWGSSIRQIEKTADGSYLVGGDYYPSSSQTTWLVKFDRFLNTVTGRNRVYRSDNSGYDARFVNFKINQANEILLLINEKKTGVMSTNHTNLSGYLLVKIDDIGGGIIDQLELPDLKVDNDLSGGLFTGSDCSLELSCDGQPILLYSQTDVRALVFLKNANSFQLRLFKIDFKNRKLLWQSYMTDNAFYGAFAKIRKTSNEEFVMAGSLNNGMSLKVLNKENNSPVISSISPSAQCANNTISISGSNFEETTKVTIGGVSVPFSVNIGGAVILANITPEVKSGDVVVTGNCGSVTFPGFRMILPPTITGFSPASACVGHTISISGTNFEEGVALQVKIGGATATYTRNSSTSLSVTVPAGAVSGNVEVTTFVYVSPNSCGGTASLAGFTLLKRPRINAINPLSSCAGSTITISGSELSGVRSVSVGGVNTTFSFNGSTNTLQVRVPSSVSSGRIVVSNECGFDERDGFVLLSVPILEQVTPLTACVNQTVILTGSHLSTVTSVQIGGKLVLFQRSGNSISVLTDSTFRSGDVVVTNSCGRDTIKDFRVISPQISSFTPLEICTDKDIAVTIRGKNFLSPSVFIGDKALALLQASDSTLRVSVPKNTPSNRFRINTTCGTILSKDTFKIVVAPVLSSFVPDTLCPGASQVDIRGEFLEGVRVTVGTQVVPSSLIGTLGDQLRINIPNSIPLGNHVLSVSKSFCTPVSFSKRLTRLGLPQKPELVSSVLCAGEKIRIKNLGADPEFNSADVYLALKDEGGGIFIVDFIPIKLVSSRSGGEIVASLPSGFSIGNYEVFVRGKCGDSSRTGLTVLEQPRIDSLYPITGCAGDTLTLRGSSFSSEGLSVRIGGILAVASIVPQGTLDESFIRATLPPGLSPGSFGVVLTAKCGTAVALDSFRLIPLPSVDLFSPSQICSDRDTVTIRGANLLNVEAKIGDVLAIPVPMSNSGDIVRITVPSNASSNQIRLFNKCGTVLSRDSLAIRLKPVLESFSPKVMCVGANNQVQITGLNLTNSSVWVSGMEVPLVGEKSDTRLTVALSAGVFSGLISIIKTPCETVWSKEPVVLRNIPKKPTFLPDSACVGEMVAVSSADLEGAEVFLGDKKVPIESSTANTLRILAPPLTVPSKIRVANQCGTSEDSDKNFHIVRASIIDGFLPKAACSGDTVQIVGSNLNFSGMTLSIGGKVTNFIPENTGSIIRAIVPEEAVSGNIAIKGAFTCQSTDKPGFERITTPKVFTFAPMSVCRKGEITIRGKNLHQAQIYIGGLIAEKKQALGDTLVSAVIRDLPGVVEVAAKSACGSSTASTLLEIKENNPPVFAGADRALCNTPGLRVMLAANKPLEGTGRWSVLPGFGQAVFDQSDNYQTGLGAMVPNEKGQLMLEWAVNGACFTSPSDQKDTLVLLLDEPAVILPPLPPDQALCDIFAADLVASPSSGVGMWSKGTAFQPGTIANSNAASTRVSALEHGQHPFVWSVRSLMGLCPTVRDTLHIIIDKKPKAEIDTAGLSGLCEANTFLLTAKNHTKGVWSVLEGPGVIPLSTISKTTIEKLVPGEDTKIQWKAISYLQTPVCPSDSVTQTLRNLKTEPAADAGVDQILCKNSVLATLDAKQPLVGKGAWSFVTGSGTVSDINDPKARLTGLVPAGDIVRLRWQLSGYRCNIQDVDEMAISLSHPLPVVNPSPAVYELCEDSVFQLYPIPFGSSTGDTYAWDDGSKDAVRTIKAIKGSAKYSLTITNSHNCQNYWEAQVRAFERPIISTLDSFQICEGDSAYLRPLITGGSKPYSYFWNQKDQAGSNAITNTASLKIGSGKYAFRTIDNKGCYAERQMVVSEYTKPNIMVSELRPPTCSKADGKVVVEVEATSPVQIYWSTGKDGKVLDFVRAGKYQVGVVDGNGCLNQMELNVGCSCEGMVGTMDPNTIKFCRTETQRSAAYDASGEVVPIGKKRWFVTHNNPGLTLGNIVYAMDSLPRVKYINGFQTGTPYYISPVIVGVKNDGSPDWDDPCIIVGKGTPIELLPTPQPPVELQATSKVICPGTTVTIQSNQQEPGFTYRWSTPKGIKTTTSPFLTIENFQSSDTGSYYISVASKVCESERFGPFKLNVSKEINEIFTEPDKTVCGLDSTWLLAWSPQSAKGKWSTTSTATILNPEAYQTKVNGLNPGRNEFFWTANIANCIVKDSLIVYFKHIPITRNDTFELNHRKDAIVMDILQNDKLLFDKNLRIKILEPLPDNNIRLERVDLLSYQRVPGKKSDEIITFKYEVCHIDSSRVCQNLCDTATVILTVLYEDNAYVAPDKIFRPSNGETTWTMRVVQSFVLRDLIIFDRWGQVIHELEVEERELFEGETIDAWDGKTKFNSSVFPGAYYYLVKGKDKSKNNTNVLESGSFYVWGN